MMGGMRTQTSGAAALFFAPEDEASRGPATFLAAIAGKQFTLLNVQNISTVDKG